VSKDEWAAAGDMVCLRRTTEDVMVRLAAGVMAVRRAMAAAERERNIVALWLALVVPARGASKCVEVMAAARSARAS